MVESKPTGEASEAKARQKVFDKCFFGRYCLIDQISKGGMSDIYLAKITGIGGFQKPLVLKKLQPQFSDKPSYVKRFLNEADTLGRLNHSNIVQILDMGIIDGEYYIAMEYIEGRNVAHIISKAIKTGRMPSLEFALFVVLEVARGLAYSHRKQGPSGESLMLVHQDVNTFNIMVSYEAEVKIIDFGIARIFLDPTTGDGLPVVGKLLYFSPEQLQKRPLDRRVDIYGTGALLYELITGRRLVDHQETVTDTVKKILATDVRDVVTRNDRIPADLKPILVRAMAFHPEERYPWMEEMIEDLKAVAKRRALDLDQGHFAAYMRQQFLREILLDQRRMRRLISGAPPVKRLRAPERVATLPAGASAALTSVPPDLALTPESWQFKDLEISGRDGSTLVVRSVNFKTGRMIFRQGDPGTDVYVILKGKVRIFLRVGKERQTVSVLGPGDFFGETALLNEPRREVSAEVKEDCSLVSLDRGTFFKFLDEALTRKILANLVEKIRDTRYLMQGLLLKDTLSLLLHALRFFDRKLGQRNGRDIDLGELKGFFGLQDNELMRRYLRKLESLDVLQANDQVVRVKNAEKLETILGMLSAPGQFGSGSRAVPDTGSTDRR